MHLVRWVDRTRHRQRRRRTKPGPAWPCIHSAVLATAFRHTLRMADLSCENIGPGCGGGQGRVDPGREVPVAADARNRSHRWCAMYTAAFLIHGLAGCRRLCQHREAGRRRGRRYAGPGHLRLRLRDAGKLPSEALRRSNLFRWPYRNYGQITARCRGRDRSLKCR